MSSDFKVYCIADVTAAPVSLSRRKDKGAFYSHIPVPIPNQLVVFAEGQWEETGDLEVTLTYKDDQMLLGNITNSNRCLYWKREGAVVPTSMMSEAEKGVAKLLIEKSDGPPVLENMLLGETKVLEDTQNTPNRIPKNKRRSSLNKEDGAGNGPSAKKLKTQGPKSTTRQRLPKAGSPATETEKAALQKKGSKLDKSGDTPKSEKSNRRKTASPKALEDKLQSKTTESTQTKINVLKAKSASPDANKKSKVEGKTPKAAQQNKKEKVAKTKKLDNRVSDDTESKKRGRKKPSDKLNESKTDVEENDCKNYPENTATQLSDTNNSFDCENLCKGNKENVDINIPILEDADDKTVNSKVKQVLDSFNKPQTGKLASCKDLTSRTLAGPTSRWGHSLCFINRNMSVLIGGQGEKQQLNKDAVWALDAETRRWKSLTTQSEGQKPEYRMGHTATYDPMVRCIYVFGGSKNTRWFHDVHMLDIDEWKWQLVKVSGKAPTRAYHSATLYRHELWIFGGVYPRPDPQPDGCSNDIHIFSPVMESWYNPIVKGDKPVPRSGHSATLLDDQLVVFGGWDAPISYSDLHILDMSIVEWTQPEVNGAPPSPRSWHASCALSNNRLLIHGGYNGDIALGDTHIFSLGSLSWTQITLENQPTPRVGHKAVCLPYRHDNEEEDEIMVFGGGDNDGAYFEDLLSIYVPFEPSVVS